MSCAPCFQNACTVYVLVRPQAIRLTPAADGAFTVKRRRSAGTHLAFTIENAKGRSFVTHTPVPSELAVGDRVDVALDEAFVTVVGA